MENNDTVKNFDIDFQPFQAWKTEIDNTLPDKPEYYLEDIPGMQDYMIELFLNCTEWYYAKELICKKLSN